jgi:hypothetical protein
MIMEQAPRKLTLTVSQESIHRATELAAALGYSNISSLFEHLVEMESRREAREETTQEHATK